MSYCRFGDADVYLYPTRWADGRDGVTCCACPANEGSFFSPDVQAVLDHIAEHRQNGDFVPDYVDVDIKADFMAGAYGLTIDKDAP